MIVVVMYEGEIIAKVQANHSLSVEDILRLSGIDYDGLDYEKIDFGMLQEHGPLTPRLAGDDKNYNRR
jgi:putative ubiquitin-RnfH superfamily antitoxin RatB of RatAB toxin-antitoxin module